MKRVFLYMDEAPRQTGSGAQLRFYSNLRGYVDLGFDVEVLRIGGTYGRVDSSALCGANLTDVPVKASASSLLGRVSYRLGLPNRSASRYYFIKHDAVAETALQRARQFPDAIHQFEGESIANVIPFLGLRKSIWSLHDIPSQATAATMKIASETEHRSPTPSELRDLRFARNVERKLALRSPLILGISKDDCEMVRRQWGAIAVEYLPMSVYGEDRYSERHDWIKDGKLRLLHLGRISHLPSYRSLEFLLTQVLPLADSETLDRIDINVVGTIEPEHPRARRVLALAAPFPQVRFTGFVEDLDDVYRASDVQIVASTEATGLRTRIIESFAFRLPVLTTTVGVRGIDGIAHDRNLIIADSAAAFISAIRTLSTSASTLSRISAEARATYDTRHSRPVVAATLERCLRKYMGIHLA